MRVFTKKYRNIFLVLWVFFSSCATVLNTPVQKVFIASDSKITSVSVEKAVVVDSSLLSLPAAKAYFVPRSHKPLFVTVQIDSATIREVTLKPKSSAAYWLNIPFNYGIGMLVDKENAKRYSFPSTNYFSVQDSEIKISRFAPIEKGTINLSLSLPLMINSFFIKTTNGQYNSGGVYGAKAGVDYFYKRNKYLSLNAGAATDIFGEYWLTDTGYFEQGDALFASLKNNKVVGSFDFGYGIHLSQFDWRKEFGDTAKKDLLVRNVGLGPALSSVFRVGKYFRLGIFYQPMLFDIKAMTFSNYQHYFSFDLLWKLPLQIPGKHR